MVRQPYRSLLLTMLGLALASCSGLNDIASLAPLTLTATVNTTTAAMENTPVTPVASPPATIAMVSARSTPRMPGCRPEEVAQLIMRFFDAFNRGDQAALPRFFPDTEAGTPNGSGQTFQWYSATDWSKDGGRHFVAYNRAQLFPYFARRHEQREQLRLRMIRVGEEQARGIAHIAYILSRQADDLPPELGGPERIAEGKGAIDCATQRLVVWSMAMNLGDVAPRPCPEPPAGISPTAVIVCGWPDR